MFFLCAALWGMDSHAGGRCAQDPLATVSPLSKERYLDQALSRANTVCLEKWRTQLKSQPVEIFYDSHKTPWPIGLSILAAQRPLSDRAKWIAFIQTLIELNPKMLSLKDQAQVGDGRQAIHQFATDNHETLIRTALQHGVSVNSRNDSDETPLHYAARAGSLRAGLTLLKKGADVNAISKHTKVTPLILAGESGNRKSIGMLLKHGARRDLKDAFGKRARDRYREFGKLAQKSYRQ